MWGLYLEAYIYDFNLSDFVNFRAFLTGPYLWNISENELNLNEID